VECDQGLRLAVDLIARTRDGKPDATSHIFALNDLRADARKLGIPDPTLTAPGGK
jgi:hypothetical protein